MPKRILVLAPHADDAEFGIGAFIYRSVAKGDHVAVAIAACGSYTRQAVDGTTETVPGAVRQVEARTALKHLGVTDVRFGELFEENRALETSYSNLVKRLELLVRAFEPTDIYVALPSFNQDHRVLYDALVTAIRPGVTNANVYAYEYPGNCWGPPLPTTGKRYLVCSPDEARRKIEALNMHKSQFDGRWVLVGPEAAKALMVLRGLEVGPDGAELVYVIREFD